MLEKFVNLKFVDKILLLIASIFIGYLGLDYFGFFDSEFREETPDNRPLQYSKHLNEAKFMSAYSELVSLRLMMTEFYQNNGHYPESIQALWGGEVKENWGEYIQRVMVEQQGKIKVQLSEEHFGRNRSIELQPIANNFSGQWDCKTNIALSRQNNACNTL